MAENNPQDNIGCLGWLFSLLFDPLPKKKEELKAPEPEKLPDQEPDTQHQGRYIEQHISTTPGAAAPGDFLRSDLNTHFLNRHTIPGHLSGPGIPHPVTVSTVHPIPWMLPFIKGFRGIKPVCGLDLFHGPLTTVTLHWFR